MSKKIVIKDKVTGEPISPVTDSSSVYDNGTTIDQSFATKEYAEWKAADIVESSPDKLDILNQLKERLNDDEDLANIVVSLIDEAKRESFNDYWNRLFTVNGIISPTSGVKTHVVGKYDPENAPDPQHPYKAYDMWLTYEEALDVVKAHSWGYGKCNMVGAMSGCRAKVAAPFVFQGTGKYDLTHMVYNDTSIEEIGMFHSSGYVWEYVTSLEAALFSGNLRKVHGWIRVDPSCKFSYAFGSNLELLRLMEIKTNINFSGCSKLNLESFQYLIQMASNSSPITITVHPKVYYKLMGVECFNIDPNYINEGNTEANIKTYIVKDHVESWTLNANGIVKPFTTEDIGKIVYMNLKSSDNNKAYYLIARISNVTGSTIETTTLSGEAGEFEYVDNIDEWVAVNTSAIEKNIQFVTV